MNYEEVKSLVRQGREDQLEEQAAMAGWVLAIELIETLKKMERKQVDPQKKARSVKSK